MLINEVPSVSLVKAAKSYWEIIFTVFAGASILLASFGLGTLSSLSLGIATGATLGLWVALKKYENKLLHGNDAPSERQAEK
jgi:hypothetical protein